MASSTTNYQANQRRNIEKLRSVLKELPEFCRTFFRGIENTTSSLTRLNYAYDIRLFFSFLCENLDSFQGKTALSISLEDLDTLSPMDIERFLEYITLYEKGDAEYENHAPGKARKLSSIRSFFKYLHKNGLIKNNPASLTDMPKLHEQPIVRLEPDEVAKLLDAVEQGAGLTKTQQRYHKQTKSRDLALLTLFLTTGIRISELTGLNVADLDFSANAFQITRKGGNRVVLYFGEETREALLQYLEQRTSIDPVFGHEDALFLSMQRTRMSVRAVQLLVKKYTAMITPLKRITPHKLRSTYGTMLYQETGDIYLVADVLGHKDVNTTKKHYAALSDEKRRMAAKAIKLRDD
ncbi:MAG: tyrosine-type recombinase/integrase [Christensenellales bacterium]|jgi:integrase/recombinase XerC